MGGLQCCRRHAKYGLDRLDENRALNAIDRLRRWSLEGAVIQVEVSDLAGNSWKFPAGTNTAGSELKAHIASLANMPEAELRLMLGCRELLDHEPLKETLDEDMEYNKLDDGMNLNLLVEEGRENIPVQLTVIRCRKYFAIVGHWHFLMLWDLQAGSSKTLWDSSGSLQIETSITCIVADWNSQIALSGSADGTLRLWDLHTSLCSAVFPSSSIEGHLIDVQVGWSLQRAISAFGDGTLCLWDLKHAVCLNVVSTKKKLTSLSVDWSDSRAMLGQSNGSLRLWSLQGEGDLSEAGHGGPWRGHLEAVSCISVDWESSQFLSASKDCKLRLWSMDDDDSVRIFRGHASGITCLSVDWRCRRALSGSDVPEALIILWDCDTPTNLLRCSGHHYSVKAVCVDWLSFHAVTASGDGTLKVWKLSGFDGNIVEPAGISLKCTQTLHSKLTGLECMSVVGCS